jgi:hypothetical protein
MPYEFTEHERDPETQTSASRRMGPPRKGTGIGVLDPPNEPGTFRWPRIAPWVGILLLMASLAALWAAWLLRR